ncbi:hypothetical protein [Flagellimonas flava]
MNYKNWIIEEVDWPGYYEATNPDDCDANVITGFGLESVQTQIDELTQ